MNVRTSRKPMAGPAESSTTRIGRKPSAAKRMKSMALASVIAGVVVTGLATAATPAYAATCTVNHYEVKRAPQPVYVWSYDGNVIGRKYAGNHVKGPNSNVTPIDSGNFRKVYLADGRTGWMWRDYLRYTHCN
ncbi:hypothetical protein AB0G05_42905 [Nonomuraea wenchangensis]